MTSNLFCLFLAFFCSCFSVNAQSWQWLKGSNCSYGAVTSVDIIADDSGNVYSLNCQMPVTTASGYTSTSYGGFFMYNVANQTQIAVTKSDALGSYNWVVFTGTSNNGPIAIAKGADGCIYFCGCYEGSANTVGTLTLLNDKYATKRYTIYLAKVTTAGGIVWAKNIFSFASGNAAGMGIDATGNIYIAGSYRDSCIQIGSNTLVNKGSFTGDMFVAGLSNSGSVLWAKSFGSDKEDQIQGFSVSRSGNVVFSGFVAGVSCAIGSFSIGGSYCSGPASFLAKLFSDGTVAWARYLTTNKDELSVADLTTDQSDNIYVTGVSKDSVDMFGYEVNPHSAWQAIYLAKFNSSGDIGWVMSPRGSYVDEGDNIAIDACGHVWLSGVMGRRGCATPKGGYSMSFDGHEIIAPEFVFEPRFTVELTSGGKYMNGFVLPGGSKTAGSLTTDNAGNLYIGGSFGVDPFVIDTLELSLGLAVQNMYLAKYAYSLSDTTSINTDTIACDLVDTVLLHAPGGYDTYSWNDGSTQMDRPGTPGTYWVRCSQNCPYAMVRTDTFYVAGQPSAIVQTKRMTAVQLVPNPTHDRWELVFAGDKPKKFLVTVCDVRGQVLTDQNQQLSISAAQLPPGTYFISVTYGSEHLVLKAVKE